ncbi:MAG: helicase HerA domain-containing protein [Candidatus Methanodesulfokora sp.]
MKKSRDKEVNFLIITLIVVFVLIKLYKNIYVIRMLYNSSLIMILGVLIVAIIILHRMRNKRNVLGLTELRESIFLLNLSGRSYVAASFLITPSGGSAPVESAVLDVEKIASVLSDLDVNIALTVSGVRRGLPIGDETKYSMTGVLWRRVSSISSDAELLDNSIKVIARMMESDGFEVRRTRLDKEYIAGIISLHHVRQFEERPSLKVPSFSSGGENTLSIEPGIEVKDLLRHMLVVGSTGSGKTTTVKKILADLWTIYGIEFVVLDYHNEYANLVASLGGRVLEPEDFSINVLKGIAGMEREELYNLVESFRVIFDLTPPQEFMLLEALGRIKMKASAMRSEPTLEELLDEVSQIEVRSQPEYETKAALLRKLYLISESSSVLSNEKLSLSSIDSPVAIELGNLKTDLGRNLYVHFFLKRVYDEFRLLKQYNMPELVIVLEEAERTIPNMGQERMTIAERVIAEMRKFGISVIVVAQSPRNISQYIIQNTGTKIVHQLGGSDDINPIKSFLGADQKTVQEVSNKIGRLRRGEFIAITERKSLYGRTAPTDFELDLGADETAQVVISALK